MTACAGRATRTCSPVCGALSQLLCLITHCLSSMPPRLAIKLRAKAQLVGNSQRFNASILAGQELAHAGSARLPVAVGAQSHSGARSQALKSARTLEGVRPLSQNFLCRRLRRHLDLAYTEARRSRRRHNIASGRLPSAMTPHPTACAFQ